MRVIFSLLGLLIVVAIIGLIAKKQLAQPVQTISVPTASGGTAQVKPAELPKKIEADVNKLMQDAAARIEKEGAAEKAAEK